MVVNYMSSLGTTRASAVEQELRRMILSGELPPGERLRQVELAERFAVSTTPVREALGALSRQGLVRHDPQRGAVVFMPTVDDVHENYELRIVLEPMATELAAKAIDDRELDQLDEIVERMRENTESPDYQQLNREFHRLIYEAARRPRLGEIIDSLRDAFEAYIQLEAATEPDLRYTAGAHEQHEAIAAALRRHDARGARKLMTRHLKDNAAHYEATTKAGASRKSSR
jgi:DNA-binding GntR family transcriptional regulator